MRTKCSFVPRFEYVIVRGTRAVNSFSVLLITTIQKTTKSSRHWWIALQIFHQAFVFMFYFVLVAAFIINIAQTTASLLVDWLGLLLGELVLRKRCHLCCINRLCCILCGQHVGALWMRCNPVETFKSAHQATIPFGYFVVTVEGNKLVIHFTFAITTWYMQCITITCASSHLTVALMRALCCFRVMACAHMSG